MKGFASYGGKGDAESVDAEDATDGGEPSDENALADMQGKKAAKSLRMALDSGDDAAIYKAFQALNEACNGE